MKYNLKDYKIHIVDSNNDPNKFVAYIEEINQVSIIIEKKEEAYDALLLIFNDVVRDMINEGVSIPPPGSKAPRLSFAESKKIYKFKYLLEDFCQRVLNTKLETSFFSDKSILTSYEHLFLNGKDELIKKIDAVYNVDVNDIYNEPLYKILELIERELKSPNSPSMQRP